MAIGADAAGGSRISFMGCNPRSDTESILPFRKAMKEGEDAVKKYICQHYQGVRWKASEALKCMLMSDDFYATELVQVKLPTLFKGRFVLVGDAGYAPGPTGTGTTLAMVGAYLLAGEVCKHKGNLDAALRGYETQLRPLINDLQKIPPLIPTLLAPQSAWGLWLRN
jgi:2-polyprenyl-6-methoxyphenol hydroxylase-like FAD-dependent oxidoreductase